MVIRFTDERERDFKRDKHASKNVNLIHTILLENAGIVSYYLINSAIRHELTP